MPSEYLKKILYPFYSINIVFRWRYLCGLFQKNVGWAREMPNLKYLQDYMVSEEYLTESGWYFVFPPLWQDRLVHLNN